MSTREPGVNQIIADILRGMRQRWEVQSEPGGAIRGGSKTPDILITEAGALPLVIENEFVPAAGVEGEAQGRLGLRLASGGQPIRAVIALRTPERARRVPQPELEAWLRACPDFEYALHRRQRGDDDSRWPASGWLRGGLADLALLAQQAMRPDEEIDELAEQLQTHISDAEVIFTEAYPQGGEEVTELLARTLRLEDDKGRQARRMAMAMLANALIFQQSLAPGMKDIPTPSSMVLDDSLAQLEVVRVWRNILKKNYFPIFHVATNILKWIDRPSVANEILKKLYSFLDKLTRSDGAARSHDLTGFVFQRLIADRKFLATFYTRPESAALLAALALPQDRPLAGADWGDADTISALQIGDFACGTGTLLSAVYNRLAALHELHGGDASALHRHMIENALVGCDVLPMATHLTLSMLASAHPDIDFKNSKILTMPYGRQERKLGRKGEYDYALGSLDLLATQEVLPTLATQPTAVEGSGETEAQERHYLPDGSFDLVIMNPPFTRPTNHAGQHQGIPNPAFAGLGASHQDQRMMGQLLSSMREKIPYHGNAGIASAFLGIADTKLRNGGVLAMVLPQIFLSGVSWEKARNTLRRNYSNTIVVTIAGEKSPDKAFSADTGLGECLLIAWKHAGDEAVKTTSFVTLRERPRNHSEGEIIAQALRESPVRRLEDGPYGGAPLKVGDDEVAQVLQFSIPEKGPWQLPGIVDFSVAQSAYHLATGNLWLPSQSNPLDLLPPLASLEELLIEKPVYCEDITSQWYEKELAPRAPFDIHRPPIHPVPTYPTLWAHDARKERCMSVDIDSEAIVRTSYSREIQEKINKKAEVIWTSATRLHMNTDFQYNSCSLCVSMTKIDSIGGRAWPSIIFSREHRATWEPAFTVWSNSTLGILLFWWQATRQQGGRGTLKVTAMPDLPTLDLRALGDGQLAAAARLFEDMKRCPMLPVNQIDEDPVRAELDRRLLSEVLGLPAELCAPDGPMDLLRRKLAAEPSIHGGKKSRVTLDAPEGCLPQ